MLILTTNLDHSLKIFSIRNITRHMESKKRRILKNSINILKVFLRIRLIQFVIRIVLIFTNRKSCINAFSITFLSTLGAIMASFYWGQRYRGNITHFSITIRKEYLSVHRRIQFTHNKTS